MASLGLWVKAAQSRGEWPRVRGVCFLLGAGALLGDWRRFLFVVEILGVAGEGRLLGPARAGLDGAGGGGMSVVADCEGFESDGTESGGFGGKGNSFAGLFCDALAEWISLFAAADETDIDG